MLYFPIQTVVGHNVNKFDVNSTYFPQMESEVAPSSLLTSLFPWKHQIQQFNISSTVTLKLPDEFSVRWSVRLQRWDRGRSWRWKVPGAERKPGREISSAGRRRTEFPLQLDPGGCCQHRKSLQESRETESSLCRRRPHDVFINGAQPSLKSRDVRSKLSFCHNYSTELCICYRNELFNCLLFFLFQSLFMLSLA